MNNKNLKIALKRLEKEDYELLKQFEQTDSRTNTFLSISLGAFSLQITLLTQTIINTYQKYIIEKHNIIALIIIILFIRNIFFNTMSIQNFRKSSKISKTKYLDMITINELVNEKIERKIFIKEEITNYKEKIIDNKRKINYKEKHINKGLNNILTSVILIIFLILALLFI